MTLTNLQLMKETAVSNQKLTPTINPYLLLLLPPLFWGGNIVVARGVTGVVPPLALSFWRWCLAFLILLPLTWRQVKQDWQTAVANWRILTLLGFLGVTCFNTLLYLAVQTTTAINGSLMQTAMPAAVIIISWLLFREKISLRQGVGVAIAISGAFFVVLRGQLNTLLQLSFVQGDLLILLAVTLYALYSVLLRKRPLIHPLSFLTFTFGAGVTLLLPIYLWSLSTGARAAMTPPTYLAILYVAIFPSILAYICWNSGIAQVGANRAGLFVNLVPVFAAIFSIIFLGEQLQPFHFVGLLLIFSGLFLFNRA